MDQSWELPRSGHFVLSHACLSGRVVNMLWVHPGMGPCEADSLKERMKRAVALLGPTEVQSIMRQEGKIEVS